MQQEIRSKPLKICHKSKPLSFQILTESLVSSRRAPQTGKYCTANYFKNIFILSDGNVGMVRELRPLYDIFFLSMENHFDFKMLSHVFQTKVIDTEKVWDRKAVTKR